MRERERGNGSESVRGEEEIERKRGQDGGMV
jgi:hypothetical protein